MKYLIILILFCISVGVGYFFSLKYLKRKRFWGALINLADKLSLEINFSRERLKVLFSSFDGNTKKYLLGIDEGFVDFLDKKCELTQENIFKNASVLKPEEKDFVLLFLKTLGRSDVENQTREIQNYCIRFGEIKAQCDTEQKKYGSLSVKLGVVVGLFIAIIMI